MTNKILFGSDIELTPYELATNPNDLDFLDSYSERLQRTVGSKSKPMALPMGGQYHPDNIFMEFATEPARDVNELLAMIHRARTYVEAVIGSTLLGRDCVKLPELDATRYPWLSRHVRHMGCEPDMVRNRFRTVPREVKVSNIKEAGMHIHIQLPDSVLNTIQPALCRRTHREYLADTEGKVQEFVELYSALTSEYHTSDDVGTLHPEYRPWYRVPGTYRIKEYGVEYRSFGAGMLDSDNLVPWLAETQNFVKDYWRAVA